ncbi:MAG: DUF1800 family protein [Woeseia sp.]|nr:DUF1800 family protein [Woeseia sp.]
MNRIGSLSLILLPLLVSCGGGGDNSADKSGGDGDGNGAGNGDPAAVVSIAEVGGETTAVEKSGQFAKFQIIRSGGGGSVSVVFALSGNPDAAKGSVSEGDIELHYSDGGRVQGNALTLTENQNSRVIEVRPVLDTLNEVPEVATFTLEAGTGYTLGTSTSIGVSVIDAANKYENRKVFLGTFFPQDGVATSATGSASFVMQGDNDAGQMNYTFSNLTSVQVDQHIHLTDGPILKDIEVSGPVSNFPWDLSLENGAPFQTEQELLDAIFDGRVYVNIHTANYPAGEIKAVFAYDSAVSPPTTSVLTPEEVDLDIVRFLNQATFGANPASYAAIRGQITADGSNRMQVYADWIDSQIQQPATEMLPFVEAQQEIFRDATGEAEAGHFIRKDAFWTVATFARDQLRQRIAYALSQILVVSEQNFEVRYAYRGTADYYDTLARHTSLTYRELLEEVSRHSVMGTYLSHLRNEKEDTEAGYYPDENFAREIMQLFSFGLFARNSNGTIKLGPDNLPIQTYDNDVIREMAQVFTGLAFSKTVSDGQMVDNPHFWLDNNIFNGYQYRWTEPLKFFEDRHDTSEKLLFTDNGAQLVVPAGTPADEELDIVLDAIVAHSGTAPYVAQRLIQRLVTSNPSPDYIERVARAFGESGDMTAVVKAILLDEEARNPTLMRDPHFGKFKEPVLQLTAMLRLHGAYSSVALGNNAQELPGVGAAFGLAYEHAAQFEAGATLLRLGMMDIGQEALNAPSVFNFYSPDFAPTGALANNSLVAPELQLLTETQVYTAFNTYHKFIRDGAVRNNRFILQNGIIEPALLHVRLNDAEVRAIWNSAPGDEASKAFAVANFLDFYMNAGRLAYLGDASTTLSLVTQALAAADFESSEYFELAAYGSVLLPDFMVQK